MKSRHGIRPLSRTGRQIAAIFADTELEDRISAGFKQKSTRSQNTTKAIPLPNIHPTTTTPPSITTQKPHPIILIRKPSPAQPFHTVGPRNGQDEYHILLTSPPARRKHRPSKRKFTHKDYQIRQNGIFAASTVEKGGRTSREWDEIEDGLTSGSDTDPGLETGEVESEEEEKEDMRKSVDSARSVIHLQQREQISKPEIVRRKGSEADHERLVWEKEWREASRIAGLNYARGLDGVGHAMVGEQHGMAWGRRDSGTLERWDETLGNGEEHFANGGRVKRSQNIDDYC